MAPTRTVRYLFLTLGLAVAATVAASDHFADERSELMQDVRDATKPVGGMLKGEMEFDAVKMQVSLATYADAAEKLRDLVPPGSEGGEAAPAIWEDPEGFAKEINDWQNTIAAAVVADPQDLDAARRTVGPVLQGCKGCHDKYRIEDE